MRYTGLIFLAVAMVYLMAAIVSCTSVPVTPVTPVVVAPSEKAVTLPWGHPEWSAALISVVGENIAKFDKAQDMKRFCPHYKEMLPSARIVAVAHLIVAVSKFESGWNAASVYHEPAPLNEDSIGLLQLSYGNKYCPSSKSKGDLKDAVTNLNCGVRIMGWLVERDGVINSANNKGATVYWSVLRNGHHVNDIAAKAAQAPGCS